MILLGGNLKSGKEGIGYGVKGTGLIVPSSFMYESRTKKGYLGYLKKNAERLTAISVEVGGHFYILYSRYKILYEKVMLSDE